MCIRDRHQTKRHNDDSRRQRDLVRPHQTLAIACAVVVAHNRQRTLIESEYRHKDEGLQLEIHTEYVDRRLREGNQNAVHTGRHN